jgi:uncharacterized protein (TIGR02679 family)
MTSTPDPRLQRLLGGPRLAMVRQRLRHRFENAEPDAAPAPIRMDGLDIATHAALCQLTGRPSRPARSMTLDIADLDARLRAAGLADSLRHALELLEGPIVPKARLQRELQARWSALPTLTKAGPRLRAWLDTPAALTLLKRLGRDPERAAQLLAAADAVLCRLPAQGQARSQLAAETLGDAHALDTARPVASLVLAAWRHHERSSTADAGMDETQTDADPRDRERADERRREVWARAGILVNELARPALLLNLPAAPDAPCTWVPGEPGYLSLRQLLRRTHTWPVAGRRIYVCENPNLVAIAADRLGADCAPLICTDGMPAAAQRILLDQLATAGAHLHYHGDYDWPGIAIGNPVIRTWQATPWRFGHADYLAAVMAAPPRPRDLAASGIEAIWDVGLRAAMDTHGLTVAEEAVAASLLSDLCQDG